MKRIFYTSLFVFACWQTSFAQPGLDLAFGNNGLVTTNVGFGATQERIASIALQPDGKIVAVGIIFPSYPASLHHEFLIVRYNPNGTLDAGFGTGGIVRTDFSNEEYNADGYATDVEILNDGSILVVGSVSGNEDNTGKMALVLYQPNGDLQTGFGSGGKVFIGAIATGYIEPSFAMQDDKIIIAGGVNGQNKTRIFRVNANGSVDGAFGTNGEIEITSSSNSFAINDVAVQSDNTILFAGGDQVNLSSVQDFVLYKYSADGQFMGKSSTDFEGEGDQINSLAIQEDGKIVAAGQAGLKFAVARYNPDGSLDNSFDNDGKLVTVFEAGASYGHFIADVAIQTDGKILAAGVFFNITDPSSPYSACAARYRSNGQLDPCFGNGGKLVVGLPGEYDRFTSVAVQPDGKALFGGHSSSPSTYDDFVLARYVSSQPVSWYLDIDGDGYGSVNSVQETCVQPPPQTIKVDLSCIDLPPFFNNCPTKIIYWVTTGGDCDESNAAIHPGAPEVCDGKDNDCDGETDEDLPTTTYYTDADSDGYGTGAGQQFCNNPGAGYATEPGDCNDNDAGIHPSANGTVELCDGIDNDCDGIIDEGCSGKPTLSVSDVTVYESEGKAVLTIRLSHITTLQVKVAYSTSDGTAVSNKKEKDYKSIGSTMLTIPPGTLTTTITVPVYNDGKAENNEYFYVNLGKPTNCLLSDVSGMVTILDGAPITSARNSMAAPIQNEVREQTEISLQAKAFPNPSSSSFTVQIDGGADIPVDVRIFNSMGQVVKALRSADRTLRFGDELQKGIYILEVRKGSIRKTIKLIKQ